MGMRLSHVSLLLAVSVMSMVYPTHGVAQYVIDTAFCKSIHSNKCGELIPAGHTI